MTRPKSEATLRRVRLLAFVQQGGIVVAPSRLSDETDVVWRHRPSDYERVGTARRQDWRWLLSEGPVEPDLRNATITEAGLSYLDDWKPVPSFAAVLV